MGVKPCGTVIAFTPSRNDPSEGLEKSRQSEVRSRVVSMTATDYPTRSLGFRPIALLG